MNMVNDTWAVAAASGLGQQLSLFLRVSLIPTYLDEGDAFHLVGHDHGACLGWKVAGEGTRGSQRILSYTALSIPHIDAFSAGLVGGEADKDQQDSSQYFALFVQNGSAGSAWNPASFYNVMWRLDKEPFGVTETGFKDPQAFQKVDFIINAESINANECGL